jgi:hypothetical protein
MISLPVAIISLIVTALVSAGGVITLLKVLTKDVNGIGRKVGSMQMQDMKIAATMLVLAKERADRELIVRMLF